MSERFVNRVERICMLIVGMLFAGLLWLGMLFLLSWLGMFGCAAKGVDATGAKGVDATKTATATAPVSTGDVGGDVVTYNVAGNAPWGIAGLCGLLWLLSKRQGVTAVKALDRTVQAIETHAQIGNVWQVKRDIREGGSVQDWWGYRTFDRSEHLIRKRLAKLEAKT